jgi:glycosyltransferase involved in cell wall biosynthesis
MRSLPGKAAVGFLPPAGLSAPENPVISVIVAAFDDCENLLRCLESLRRQTQAPDQREVIVVDDGSTDGTSEAISERFPEVRLLRQENAGPDAARNAGVSVARGEILAFIDSDCTAPPEWLDALQRSLDTGGSSIVGGRILHPGPFWARVIGVSDFGEFLDHRPKTVKTIPTCNMGIRSEVMRRHLFESRWKMLGDVFFSHTLGQSGEHLVYDPGVWLYHHPSSSFAYFCRRSFRYGEGFVRTRRAMPSLPHSQWVRTGVPGIVTVSLGRVVLDWVRLLRFRRSTGFSAFSLPVAAAGLLFKRILGAAGAVKAWYT